MSTGTARREAKHRHAANRLFLEITLVMIFMVLLSYAPVTSQTTFSETAATPNPQQQGQSTSGREAWLHLDASGALSLKSEPGKNRHDWPDIQAYLQEHGISVVVIDPERDVPFAILSEVWQRIVQSGSVVRIATK